MSHPGEQLFLTTQPGWAFATLAELRRRGNAGHLTFWHRDSSIIADSHASLLSDKLATPAEVFGCIIGIEAKVQDDATALLHRRLSPASLKQAVLCWLPSLRNTQRRRYSITAEVYGTTSLHRRSLADLLQATLHQAFPRWRRTASEGLRFYCKADRRAAVVGLQLYSNLSSGDDRRPGSLREHLACGLLALSGARPEETVFDPFMGTGTILAAASQRFRVRACIGLEIDPEAYAIAMGRINSPHVSLLNISFEAFDTSTLPDNARLVSNVPFGVRFARVATEKLLGFIRSLPPAPRQITLLASREQAKEMVPALGLRKKNVLVLGHQPAFYTPLPRTALSARTRLHRGHRTRA